MPPSPPGLIRLPSPAWARNTTRWDQWRPYYQRLERKTIHAGNAMAWLESLSSLYALSQEAMSMAYWQVVTSRRADASRRMEAWQGEMGAQVSAAHLRLEARALSMRLRHSGDGQSHIEWRQRKAISSPEQIDRALEISKLASDICVTANTASHLSWEGRRRPSSQVAEALYDGRRWRRQRAWTSLTRGVNRRWKDCDQDFSRLMALRQEQASAAGFPSSYAHTFALQRRPYESADIERWCHAVQQVAVPALGRLRDRTRHGLGVASLAPWDLEYNPSALEPSPIANNEILEASATVLHAVHPALAEVYSVLRKRRLVRLLPYTNVRAENLCHPLPATGLAFCTVVGEEQSSTILSLCHEITHAAHAIHARRDCPMSWTYLAPIEVSELAAIAIEMLALNHLDKVLPPLEAAMVALTHWEQAIIFLTEVARTEDFQRWCYGPGPTPDSATCDIVWEALCEDYDPKVRWRGHSAPSGWRLCAHLLETPGYYIEYGMATIGAIQIWDKARRNPEAAIERILSGMSLGGTVDARAGYRAMGARLSFDIRSVRHAVDLAEKEIARLRRTVARLSN